MLSIRISDSGADCSRYCSVSVPSMGLEDELLISLGNCLETGFPKVTLCALKTSAAGRCYTSSAQLDSSDTAELSYDADRCAHTISCYATFMLPAIIQLQGLPCTDRGIRLCAGPQMLIRQGSSAI